MTEPVRPLEALIAEKIAEWRAQSEKDRDHGDSYRIGRGWGLEECADELAALLQAAAPPAPTAEPRRPLPPEVLADALQDRIGPTSGKLIRATPVHVEPPERVSDDRAQLRQQLNDVDEAFGFGYFPSDGTGRVGMILEYKRDCVAAQPERVSEGKPWCQICGVELTGFYCDTCHAALADTASGPAVEPREEPTDARRG